MLTEDSVYKITFDGVYFSKSEKSLQVVFRVKSPGISPFNLKDAVVPSLNKLPDAEIDLLKEILNIARSLGINTEIPTDMIENLAFEFWPHQPNQRVIFRLEYLNKDLYLRDTGFSDGLQMYPATIELCNNLLKKMVDAYCNQIG